MEFLYEAVARLFEWIQLGYFGIMIGLMVEVIPSEIVLAYGGYLVSLGEVNFIGAMILALLAVCSHSCLFIGSAVTEAGPFGEVREVHID